MLLCEMVQRDNVLAARRVPNDDDALAAELHRDEEVRALSTTRTPALPSRSPNACNLIISSVHLLYYYL